MMQKKKTYHRLKIISKQRFYIFLTCSFLLIMFLLSSVFRMSNAMDMDSKNNNGQDAYDVVFVETGDTLWSIASRHKSKNYDIRKYIHTIIEINDMDSPDIFPGDMIKVPIPR